MSPWRIRGHDRGVAGGALPHVLVGLQPRLGDAAPRRVAQLVVPLQADDLPQVGEVQQPVDVVDLRLLDVERADQVLAQARVHLRAQLDPHDLAEAAAADLGLHGLEQVVGLVGDLVVGVAGDRK